MDEEQRQTQKKKSPYWALASAVLTSLGIFYRFILRGYVYWGYLCFFIVFLILAHRFLPAILWKIILVLTCIGFVYFWIVEIPIIRSARTDPDPERPYLVVLGAAVYGDQPSLTLVRRMEGALDYLEAYPESRVVVSGGMGKGENTRRKTWAFPSTSSAAGATTRTGTWPSSRARTTCTAPKPWRACRAWRPPALRRPRATPW